MACENLALDAEIEHLRAALRRIATAKPLIGGQEAYVMRRIAKEALGDEQG